MTEHEKPREWTLLSGRPAYMSPSVAPMGPQLPNHGESVRVVEAEPVEREREEMLDLLEACEPQRRSLPIKALLRKHGRLKDD